jgi:signal transduction histidine kinase
MGAVLFGALIVLAVLQYRWIGQVSESDRDSLQRQLRTALGRFTDDFDGEFDRLIQILSNGTPSSTTSDEAILASRLELWRGLAAHPQLVKQVWLTEAPDLPVSLQRLASRLPENIGGRPGGRGRGFPIQLDSSIPAFALARIGWNPGNESDKQRWLIVELDPGFIHSWLPDLVAKDFGTDYHVRIFGANPDSALFQTPNAPPGLGADGGAAPLFSLRQNLPGRGRGGFNDNKGQPDSNKGPPDGFYRDFGKDFGKRPFGETDSAWRVEAAFRSGSTTDLVESLRHRNLAVSFGILLLMGVSIATLIRSTRRANALAQQQMEFVAGVTHELRTPLAVVLSASQNLADGVAAGEAQVRRYGGVINAQTKRLSSMVEQVLRFAGLSSQHGELQRGPVEVPTLIHEAIADCQADLEAAGARVTQELDPSVPPIDGDHAALLHALRNLLENAAKHGAGANVWVRARATEHGMVEIVIEDEGPGIDAEDLPHVFEPFYRGNRAKHEQVQGSGLGLSLVRKVVEAHGGSIEASSRLGNGTAFHLLLPPAKAG